MDLEKVGEEEGGGEVEGEPCLAVAPCGERVGSVEANVEETSLYEWLDEVFGREAEDAGEGRERGRAEGVKYLLFSKIQQEKRKSKKRGPTSHHIAHSRNETHPSGNPATPRTDTHQSPLLLPIQPSTIALPSHRNNGLG
jgi:hypothetical protein